MSIYQAFISLYNIESFFKNRYFAESNASTPVTTQRFNVVLDKKDVVEDETEQLNAKLEVYYDPCCGLQHRHFVCFLQEWAASEEKSRVKRYEGLKNLLLKSELYSHYLTDQLNNRGADDEQMKRTLHKRRVTIARTKVLRD